MIRRIVIVISIVALVIVGTIFVVKATRQRSRERQWQTSSPHQTYKIVFRGTSTTPVWPFTHSHDVENRKVTVGIAKNGVLVVERAEIYDGDAYDYSFDDLYPDREWISENILHLWHKRDSQRPEAISEEILVSNESRRSIKYFYLKAGKTNLFLLFDVPVGARITLPIRLQHWEEVIGCEGKFEDRDFPYCSEDFSLSTAGKVGTRYKVTIAETACSVTREP